MPGDIATEADKMPVVGRVIKINPAAYIANSGVVQGSKPLGQAGIAFLTCRTKVKSGIEIIPALHQSDVAEQVGPPFVVPAKCQH